MWPRCHYWLLSGYSCAKILHVERRGHGLHLWGAQWDGDDVGLLACIQSLLPTPKPRYARMGAGSTRLVTVYAVPSGPKFAAPRAKAPMSHMDQDGRAVVVLRSTIISKFKKSKCCKRAKEHQLPPSISKTRFTDTYLERNETSTGRPLMRRPVYRRRRPRSHPRPPPHLPSGHRRRPHQWPGAPCSRQACCPGPVRRH